MSYNQWSGSTSHQQAFPPLPPQAMSQYASPPHQSRYTYQSNSSYYQPQTFYLSPTGYADPIVEPQRQYGRKGYEYLKSLNSSMGHMSMVDNRHPHTTNEAPTNSNRSYASSEPRHRLHSDPVSPTTSPDYNKRLPALPPPPFPPQPSSNRYEAYTSMYNAGPSQPNYYAPPIPPRPTSLPLPDTHPVDQTPLTVYPATSQSISTSSLPVNTQSSKRPAADETPRKTFRPSVHPHSKPRISDENRLRPPSPHTPIRPHSDTAIPTASKSKGKGKATPTSKTKSKRYNEKKGEDDPDWNPIIDLTLYSSSEDSQSDHENVTPRSPARRKRAVSEQPNRASPNTKTPIKTAEASQTPVKADAPGVVQCSGFTRTGQPCKRLVKASAPYLSVKNTNVEEGDERSDKVMGRYCKDHAGMICQADGFYWRGSENKAGIWIDFDEFIPPDLGQQTQTLLRMTMESKLTAKESPGYLYVYELRDLETPAIAYFKVGRTDNVPRRIGEWTNQCQSKKPTLRDIYPLPPPKSKSKSTSLTNGLQRTGTLTTSFLPGATKHLNPPLRAMKRWERLVHIELSDRSSSGLSKECIIAFEKVREKCKDCGLSHKEIFPVYKYQNDNLIQAYEGIVMEVIVRWDRFIRRITEDQY